MAQKITPKTIVIKLGTSSIVHEISHQTHLATLSALVETVVELRKHGHKVVLVSSGAIGVGLRRMNLAKRPDGLARKQALAAIGQGRLIALWDNLFGQFEQAIAQVLLTRTVISDRTRYMNAVNTFKELLSMNVVPIVNENDTVSVAEIKFGDNDTLSAITSSMICADYLFLLTDVDGLYTCNPRGDPNASHIHVVDSIPAVRAQVSTETPGSSLGTGGMETKLVAADIATAAGVRTIIANGKEPGRVLRILEYDVFMRNTDGASSLSCARPPHTLFVESREPIRDLKSWTRHTLNPSGSIIIDEGAYLIISKREYGDALLAVGVIGVIGEFVAQQAVRIVVKKDRIREEDREQQKDLYLRDLREVDVAQPNFLSIPMNGNESESIRFSNPGGSKEGTLGEKDVIEVGRGLANYNSAQIMAVKGLISSYLPQVLGYTDSEFVVEHITINLPFGHSATP